MTEHILRTPRGNRAVLHAREGTSDLAVIGATFAGVAGSPLVDEYGLADIHTTGRLVDVGAHIGSVTVAFLIDNPDATALCVEPIPENVKALRANLAANGLTKRAKVIAGAVGTDTVYYGFDESEFARTNRYIGNLHTPLAPSKAAKVRHVTLSDLLPAAVMKLDCEGGEWSLFADPRITEVPVILGEYHGGPGADGIRDVFAATHDVAFTVEQPTTGNFRAVAR